MVRSFATPYSFALTEIGDRTRSQADGKGVGPNCQPEDFEADSFFIRNGISAFRCKLCPLTCCSERVLLSLKNGLLLDIFLNCARNGVSLLLPHLCLHFYIRAKHTTFPTILTLRRFFLTGRPVILCLNCSLPLFVT